MMNAANEREAPEAECQSTEIPALLVAGGSCSHLCRSPRATADARLPTEASLRIQSRETRRAVARESRRPQ